MASHSHVQRSLGVDGWVHFGNRDIEFGFGFSLSSLQTVFSSLQIDIKKYLTYLPLNPHDKSTVLKAAAFTIIKC